MTLIKKEEKKIKMIRNSLRKIFKKKRKKKERKERQNDNNLHQHLHTNEVREMFLQVCTSFLWKMPAARAADAFVFVNTSEREVLNSTSTGTGTTCNHSNAYSILDKLYLIYIKRSLLGTHANHLRSTESQIFDYRKPKRKVLQVSIKINLKNSCTSCCFLFTFNFDLVFGFDN